jgi:hypothetical protein
MSIARIGMMSLTLFITKVAVLVRGTHPFQSILEASL